MRKGLLDGKESVREGGRCGICRVEFRNGNYRRSPCEGPAGIDVPTPDTVEGVGNLDECLPDWSAGGLFQSGSKAEYVVGALGDVMEILADKVINSVEKTDSAEHQIAGRIV